MPRYVKVAAAQMGPNNEGTPRDEIIARMARLMEQAIADRVEILVYPEMALTPYFPKRLRDDHEQFFEQEVPPKILAPVLRKAAAAGIICHVGFCERDGNECFNTAILVGDSGEVIGRFRKIHLPGYSQADPHNPRRVYEPYYFNTGNTGLQVFETPKARIGIAICQNRRYSETYRCLGLLGAELILIGYNTPAEPQALALNELVMRAGAYENMLFVVGVARRASRMAWS